MKISFYNMVFKKKFNTHIVLTNKMHPYFFESWFQILFGQRFASHQVGKHAEHSATFPINIVYIKYIYIYIYIGKDVNR